MPESDNKLMAISLQTPADVADPFSTLAFTIRMALLRVSTATAVKVLACSNNGGVSPWGTVDVQPLLNQLTEDGQAIPHGPLYRLPYCRLQGGTNAVILDPQPGDIGVAVFASRDISALKTQDAIDSVKSGTVVGINPGSFRTFDMSDGLYLGGALNGTPNQFVAFSSAGINILSPTKVIVQAPLIELTADTSVTVTAPAITLDGDVHVTGDVTGDAGATFADDVIADGISVSTHTHGGVQPGGGNTDPPNP